MQSSFYRSSLLQCLFPVLQVYFIPGDVIELVDGICSFSAI